jgi:hypothetical protein
MSNSIVVFPEGNGFQAITEFTRQPVAAGRDAGAVIQAAVDAAAPGGGEVRLAAGRYPVAAPVKMRSHVRLHGGGRGTRLIAAGSEAAVLCEGLDGAEVAGLALLPAERGKTRAGLVMDACGDCQATNLFAGGFGEHGIWLRNHAFLCTIRGCSAAGNGQSNIFLDTLAEKGRSGEFIPNLVADCMVYGGGEGIETRRTIVANIVGCCVFQTHGTGFHIHSESNSVVINGCRTFQVGKYAVLLEDTDEFNLSGNIFCWHLEDGVVIRNARWGSVCGNEIIDTGSFNSGAPDRSATWDTLPGGLPPFSGLKLVNVHGYNITGNTIFNWPVCPPMEYGVYEDEACFKNSIVGNNINFFTKQDVLSKGSESLCANNVGFGELPHQRRGGLQTFFQTFQTNLTRQFIDDQLF